MPAAGAPWPTAPSTPASARCLHNPSPRPPAPLSTMPPRRRPRLSHAGNNVDKSAAGGSSSSPRAAAPRGAETCGSKRPRARAPSLPPAARRRAANAAPPVGAPGRRGDGETPSEGGAGALPAAAGGARGGRRPPHFVVAPGAFVGYSSELLAQLGQLGTVQPLIEPGGRWPGGSSVADKKDGTKNKNVALLRDTAEAAAAGTGSTVHLVGSSFGCRVVVALLLEYARAAAAPPPAGVATASGVLHSYPLYGDNKPVEAGPTDRVAPLRALPATTRLVFVSGAKDEFLDRGKSWRAGQSVGAAALRRVVHGLACAAEARVLVTDAGAHATALLGEVEGSGRAAPEAFKEAVRALLQPRAP